jgi:hypothetical protein
MMQMTDWLQRQPAPQGSQQQNPWGMGMQPDQYRAWGQQFGGDQTDMFRRYAMAYGWPQGGGGGEGMGGFGRGYDPNLSGGGQPPNPWTGGGPVPMPPPRPNPWSGGGPIPMPQARPDPWGGGGPIPQPNPQRYWDQSPMRPTSMAAGPSTVRRPGY